MPIISITSWSEETVITNNKYIEFSVDKLMYISLFYYLITNTTVKKKKKQLLK